jgi:hypothetical protein
MEPAARPLDLLSGPWSARWRQAFTPEGRESLDLVFQSGQVQGFGLDGDGEFQYVGSYWDDGRVLLGKTYTRPNKPVPARMTYRGQRNGRRIQGTWTDDRDATNAGPFRGWPGTGPDPGEVLEREAEVPGDPVLVQVPGPTTPSDAKEHP